MPKGPAVLRWAVLAGFVIFTGVTVTPSLAAQGSDCARRSAAGPVLARLTATMADGRFVAYAPTSLQVVDGISTVADPESIAADLRVLRPRFDGLITYTAANGVDRAVDEAAALGFRAVIVGLYNIADPAERELALNAARRWPDLVVGVSVGNEAVFGRRNTIAEVAEAIDAMHRAAPTLAISTTEPFHLWLGPDARAIRAASDMMLANVHPVFEPWFRGAPAANAAEFVTNVVDQLAADYCGPILVKESGAPSAPAELGFTPQRQAEVYRALHQAFVPGSRRAFAYFSAFDSPWREFDAHPVPGPHPEEAHWGLYDAMRNPKQVVDEIPLLPSPSQ